MFSFFSPTTQTIKKLLVERKGILAADETPTTIGRRFAPLGIENTPENRRIYREMLFTTPTLSNYVSGVILQDETIRQSDAEGKSFVKVLRDQNISVGIKVDQGLELYNGSSFEKITLGIDTLPERLKEYYSLGARFAKWRAVFQISPSSSSKEAITASAELLADYANFCHKQGIVPIVEPEVLADGNHSVENTFEVTSMVLETLFSIFAAKKVSLAKILLKPNMIVPGVDGQPVLPEIVAEKTVECFKQTVPKNVPGIVFLSGGQSEEEACINLQKIVEYGKQCPWDFSFSFGRALQNSAMRLWGGERQNVEAAQALFLQRLIQVSAARSGTYQSF